MPSFHRLAAFSAILGAFAIGSGGAQASTSVWDHNGSTLRLDENGKKRTFVYDDPRGTLVGAGVKRGTVLFDGEEKADGRLAGYAKLFRKGCSPVDYFVEGSFDKQKGEILLQGQAPIYSGNGCKITGYSDNGSASSLSFSRIGGSNDYVAHADEGISDTHRDRPSYLPPSHLPPSSLPPSSDQASRDDRTYGTDRDERSYGAQAGRDPHYDARSDPPRDDAAQDRSQRDDGQRDYGRGDDAGPDYYGHRYSSEPDYGRRDYYPRDYAARRDYYRRYDYYGYPVNPDAADDYDSSLYNDEDDPAYIPYQPRWRRY